MVKTTKKKLNKKNNQRIKTLVLITGLLICCCIVFGLLLMLNGRQIYKIESRVQEIAKEKTIDKKDTGYETIAWLRVQGTKIDAPIVSYTSITALDNVDKTNFLWNGIDSEKIYNQVAISGHNILNLSSNPQIGLEYFTKFEDLMAFAHEEFMAENKYIQYTIDGEDYIYKIFGVFFEKDYNLDLHHQGDYTKEETQRYLDMVEELTIYDFDIEVDNTDSIITLTTCTRMFGRADKRQFVVVGRLLREDERMTNYDVTANEKYEVVREKLKGDESNEKA